MVTTAAALAMTLFTTAPAYAATPLDPPAPGIDALNIQYLPRCETFLTNTVLGTPSGTLALEQASTALGWNTRGGRMQVGGTQPTVSQITPAIPCRSTSDTLYIPFTEYRFTGVSSTVLATTTSNGVYTCASSTGTISTFAWTSGGAPRQNLAPGQRTTRMLNSATVATVASCPYIISVTLTLTYGTSTNTPVALRGTNIMETVRWSSANWRTSDGGWSPAASDLDLVPPGFEVPIVCEVDTSGADIFEITRNYWDSIVQWVPCMLIPKGWDRGGKIQLEWNASKLGQLSDAYDAAVPNTIACGTAINIPFYSETIGINTCSMDVAPAWVKSALSGVIILGIVALSIRRVMWSVGSKG